jgi:hypothetical protein
MNHLNTVLADALEESHILRRNGHALQADTIERLVASVKAAAADYLAWIPEHEAMLRAGRQEDFFRARRKQWEEDGLAECRNRQWYYRRVIVPRRKLDSIVRAEARHQRKAS